MNQAPYPTVPPRPRPNGNTAVIVTVVLGVVVLLLGGGAIGAYVYVNRPQAVTVSTLPSLAPTTPPPASVAPSPPVTTAPPSPLPSPSPTATGGERAGTPLVHEEFQDWEYASYSGEYNAWKVAGWTYSSCAPLDVKGVLAEHHCGRAVQLAFSAENGHIKILQIMASFPTDQDAGKAAARITQARITLDGLAWKSTYAHTYAGKGMTISSKNYLIATVVTTDKTGQPHTTTYLTYLMVDRMVYLRKRDRVVTS
ncbi:hypothetical protein [Nonomuraea sp. NPDC049309]|uniref:hypothetical protein n=1 Tax=Nonomuraea sp. NPDC049309 TaxID=3364350 RepID=UPI00371C6F8F